jgi:hypothetical protein
MTAMIVCIFEHVQWRWAHNDRLAHGYSSRPSWNGGTRPTFTLSSNEKPSVTSWGSVVSTW